MTEDIILGAVVGVLLSLVVGRLWVNNYKSTLLLCSKSGTPEKLGESFYYIVEESEYNRVKQQAMRNVLGSVLHEQNASKVITPVPHA